jgi:hypothetical protein
MALLFVQPGVSRHPLSPERLCFKAELERSCFKVIKFMCPQNLEILHLFEVLFLEVDPSSKVVADAVGAS